MQGSEERRDLGPHYPGVAGDSPSLGICRAKASSIGGLPPAVVHLRVHRCGPFEPQRPAVLWQQHQCPTLLSLYCRKTSILRVVGFPTMVCMNSPLITDTFARGSSKSVDETLPAWSQNLSPRLGYSLGMLFSCYDFVPIPAMSGRLDPGMPLSLPSSSLSCPQCKSTAGFRFSLCLFCPVLRRQALQEAVPCHTSLSPR